MSSDAGIVGGTQHLAPDPSECPQQAALPTRASSFPPSSENHHDSVSVLGDHSKHSTKPCGYLLNHSFALSPPEKE